MFEGEFLYWINWDGKTHPLWVQQSMGQDPELQKKEKVGEAQAFIIPCSITVDATLVAATRSWCWTPLPLALMDWATEMLAKINALSLKSTILPQQSGKNPNNKLLSRVDLRAQGIGWKTFLGALVLWSKWSFLSILICWNTQIRVLVNRNWILLRGEVVMEVDLHEWEFCLMEDTQGTPSALWGHN